MLRLKKHLTNYFLLLWLVKISTEVSYPRLIQLFSSTNWNRHVEFHERPEKIQRKRKLAKHIKFDLHFFRQNVWGRRSKIQNKGGKFTSANIWGYQIWNFWLISVLKICLYYRGKGGSKSLKMCLCNIWMVSNLTGPIEIKMAQS